MIECYKEDDFLKPFRAASGLWYFKYEDLLINVASPAYEIGLCQNSIPLYCRCGNVNDAGNSLLHEQSWQHDNVEQYNQQCPKCGWGVYAFFAGHGRLQDDGCIRFYDDGKGVATALIVDHLQGLNNYCGCKNKMDIGQRRECAMLISCGWGFLKVTELCLFFLNIIYSTSQLFFMKRELNRSQLIIN